MFLRNLFKKAKTEQHEKKPQGPSKSEALEAKRYPRLITDQAADTAGIVASFLEAKDLAHVSQACKKSNALFSKTLAVKTLLQAVVFGDMEKAKAMIQKNPQLLLERGTVKDYSGRTHSNRTAFQLALGACDFNVKDAKGNIVVDGMVEMIEEHFNNTWKSPEQIRQIMHNQYITQFPETDEAIAIEAKRVTDDSAALHRIINVIADVKDEKDCIAVSDLENEIYKIRRTEKSARADELRNIIQSMLKASSSELFDKAFQEFTDYVIKNKLIKSDAFNLDLLKALYQFRNYLEPKRPQTTGKHFNHQLLAEVAQLYDQNYVRFGNDWDGPKNLFCWQKVFGGVERHVPACDAQSIAQGLLSILEYGEKSHRSLSFTYGGGKYFPLNLDPNWEVGHNCCGRSARAPCLHVGWASKIFKSYVEQKQQCRSLSSSLDDCHRRAGAR